MSASFASAMMNARERGLDLISASLMSRDFMEEFRNPNVEGRRKSEFRSPNGGASSECSLQISGLGFLSDFGFPVSVFPSHFHLRQRVLQRLGRVLEAHHFLRPQLDLHMPLDTIAA